LSSDDEERAVERGDTHPASARRKRPRRSNRKLKKRDPESNKKPMSRSKPKLKEKHQTLNDPKASRVLMTKEPHGQMFQTIATWTEPVLNWLVNRRK